MVLGVLWCLVGCWVREGGYLITSQDNLSLDQIRDEGLFNFLSVYENDEEADSPFEHCDISCEYYEPHDFRELAKSLTNTSSFFHLNCRSISANWEGITSLLYDLQGENFSFDYIGMSEVFKCDRDSRLNLPGFHDFITRTRVDRNGGGVGIFIKENINFKIRDDLSVFIPHLFESIFIETSTRDIVGVIYRPPNSDIDIFSSTLFDIMEIINNEFKHCTLLGDYNIDLLKYNLHDDTNNFVDNVFAQGFVPMIHRPTRVTHSTATLIDHIYTNNITPNCTSGIILSDITDHFATFYAINTKLPNQKMEHIERRIFSEANVNHFRDDLNQTDFTPILQETNCERAYSDFISIYTHYLNINFPKTTLKTNKKYLKKEIWMTEGLLKSLRTKSNLFTKKLKQPSEFNIEYYKSYSNKYNRLRREMKKLYYKKILEVNKNNMKNTWKILKDVIGKTNNKSNFPQSFLIDESNVSNKHQIANSFNKYFSSIGKKTSQNVPNANKSFSQYLKNPSLNSIFIEPVDSQYILEVVNKFKPKTSYGHDEIPTKLVKNTITDILDPITHIVNLSLTTGIVPSQLKQAKVVPIYKASSPNLLENYRPISLLPAFSKILEKIMYNKIMSYLTCQNILYKHQYGFRPKYQTIHPVMHLLNQCALANNSKPKQYTASVFVTSLRPLT